MTDEEYLREAVDKAFAMIIQNRKMGQSQAWNDDNANAGNYKYFSQNLYFNSTTAITELNITSSGTLGGGTYKLYGVK